MNEGIVGGLFVGFITFLTVGALTSALVLQTSQTGIAEGIFAAIWAAWPCFVTGREDRYNYLHPVPRRYKVSLKQCFARVRQIIAESTYQYGDKWHVTTADTVQRRVTATLRFSEEETHLEGGSMNGMHAKTKRVQRLLLLDAQFKEGPNDTTVVQFDFSVKTEGGGWNACDPIISSLLSQIGSSLGHGETAGDPAGTTFPAPPWWLIGIGVFGLFVLFCDICKAVFAP